MVMKREINVGIVGFGLAGKVFQAPIINAVDGLNIKKIVTTNTEAIAFIDRRYPNAVVVQNIDILLQDNEIDLVVIATPNTTHLDFVKKALLANKHVVVEKPFTVTSKEADELIDLANKQNKILTVHQNRRWDSDYLTIKKVLQEELLGNVVEYEAHFDRFRNTIKENWREENIPGSGVLYDLGSHLIDQALCLFGTPKEVTGHMGIQRKGGKVEDYFEVLLQYDNLRAILKAGSLVREALPHFIVLGNKGSFVKYGMDVQEAALKKGESPCNNMEWGKEPRENWGILNTELKDLSFRGIVESEVGDYRGFYRNVYNAILGKEKLKVKPEEARNVIRIIELAMESSRQKCTLPFN